MKYIIKKVPRINNGNPRGYRWDTKNTTYLTATGTWTRYKSQAAVFDGSTGDAKALASKTRLTCTGPNECAYVGAVEVSVDETGRAAKILEDV